MSLEPVLIRQREIQDDELRQMLHSAVTSGDTADFFRHFEYYFADQPFLTLCRGEAMLTRCNQVAPEAYAKLSKGTPFYWLAWAAFELHDYETCAFYIDAAVADDLRAADENGTDRQSVSSPALKFFLVDDRSTNQALLRLVAIVRSTIDRALIDYNGHPEAKPPLSMNDVQRVLLHASIPKGSEHLRTLVTTFISFFLEWDHRSSLIERRTDQGTAEPFFLHLFKGCVLFESLLKANTKNKPKSKTLGPILKELKGDLGFASQNDMTISGFAFEDVLKELPLDKKDIYTAIERTGRIRNTTGHDLGWATPLTPSAYNSLAAYVASACLHAVASLYR
jgi:hypothetical protein